MTEEEVQASLQRPREHLQEKLKEAPTMINAKESHQAAFAKELHMEKLRDALRIDSRHEFGAAFDLELQEKKRLDRLAESESVRKEKKKAKKEAKKVKEREELQKQLQAIKDAPKDGSAALEEKKQEKEKKKKKHRKHSSSDSESSGSSSSSSSESG